MKIAYISSSYIPSSAANSVHVMRMCDAFVQNGHETLLLCRKPEGEAKQSADELRRHYGTRNVFAIQTYFHGGHAESRIGHLASTVLNFASIAGKLHRFRADLVYGRDVYGCHVAATLGYPVILESHRPLDSSSSIERIILDRLTRHPKLQHVVTISNPLAQRISNSRHFVDKSRILVAHDAADRPPDRQIPQGWQGLPGRIQVGYCGSFYPGRGIGLMLDLVAQFPHMEFHFMGGDVEQAQDYCDTVPENVYFYGFVPPSQVYRHRNACDILLAPYEKKVSVSGGKGDTSAYMSPLKVFEYMSNGKAIIVSNMPVLHEVLEPGRNCLMAEPGSLPSWAEALGKLEDGKLRARLGQNAEQDFIERHTWDKRIDLVLRGVDGGSGVFGGDS